MCSEVHFQSTDNVLLILFPFTYCLNAVILSFFADYKWLITCFKYKRVDIKDSRL